MTPLPSAVPLASPGGRSRSPRELTRRGFLLLAGLSLVACAEGSVPAISAADQTARPTARSTTSPGSAARASSPNPTPATTVRSVFPCAPLPSNSDRLAKVVREELGSRKGTFGVAIQRLDTGESYLQGGERPFPSASLYKLSVLYEAGRQISLGRLTLDTKLTIKKEDVVENEPLGGVDLDETYTLAAILDRMIAVSSNAAAHCLLRTLGRPTINRSVADLGLLDTKLTAPGVRTGVHDGEGDEVASTSPRDMLTFFRLLGNGSLLGAEASKGMRDILLRQAMNDRLPSLLPPNTRVAHKTGELVAVRNDAGIVYSPKGAYVIAVLASSVDEADATLAIAHLSRTVYDLFVSS